MENEASKSYELLNEQHESLKKLHDSTNLSCKRLETENAELRNINAILDAEKRQWEQQKILQTQIIQQEVERMDKINKDYIKEIEELRAKIKLLEEN